MLSLPAHSFQRSVSHLLRIDLPFLERTLSKLWRMHANPIEKLLSINLSRLNPLSSIFFDRLENFWNSIGNGPLPQRYCKCVPSLYGRRRCNEQGGLPEVKAKKIIAEQAHAVMAGLIISAKHKTSAGLRNIEVIFVFSYTFVAPVNCFSLSRINRLPSPGRDRALRRAKHPHIQDRSEWRRVRRIGR